MMTVVAMGAAMIALFVIGVIAARNEIAAARGLERIVALSHLCFAIPLAAFGALHLFGPQFVAPLVPPYMPWRAFWVYFVGCALIAASLSIATRTAVRWSGLLVGIMMFSFVAMIHLPGALGGPPDRIIWTIVFRELSFGGGGWLLAGAAPDGWREPARSVLINVGRVLVAITVCIFWSRTLSPRDGTSWSPAPEGNADVDSGPGAHRLCDGCRSSRHRRKRSAVQEHASRRGLCWRLDLAADPRRLWPCSGAGAIPTRDRHPTGRGELLCRHAALCGNHSRPGERVASIRLNTPPLQTGAAARHPPLSRARRTGRDQPRWFPCTCCSCLSRSGPAPSLWRRNRRGVGTRSRCWRSRRQSTP